MPGKIPERFINDLLARIDIVELIDGFVPLRKMGKDYKACCPFHEEKTPSFTVSSDKQFYHCFGCGAHGTAIGFLMEYEHLGFREAIEDLAKRAGMPLPTEVSSGPAPNDEIPQMLELMQTAERYYQRQLREHPQAHVAVDYLKRRGLTGEIAQRFGLGFAPDAWDGLINAVGIDAKRRETLVQTGLLIKKDSGGYYDRFRGRVMFPIQDYRGRIIGFGGRVIGTGEPKYLNSPETPLFHKGRELYGLYAARDTIKREQRVLVVEGYMDVVALAQYGIDYAVATLGTATTRDHLDRLFRFAPEIVFCFDGDRAGREAAWRALETTLAAMHEGRQASFLFLPDGEDPDTLVRKEGMEAFAARVRGAQALPDFLFRHLLAQVDIGRLDGRARLVELAKPLLARIPPGPFADLMIGRLSELARLPAARVAETSRRPAAPSRSPSGATGKKDLLRCAVALLIQQPDLVRFMPEADVLLGLPLRGSDFLFDLTALIKSDLSMNTAAILEHYRDGKYSHTLAQLAIWDYPQVITDPAKEFQDLVQRLLKLAINHAIEQLSNKRHVQGLTHSEDVQFRHLLAEQKRLMTSAQG